MNYDSDPETGHGTKLSGVVTPSPAVSRPFDLSVVIVSWNVRDLLLQCLSSLIETCSELRLEIIVVDNASFDGSVAAAKDEFPDIRFIENLENRGFSKASNQGLAVARGRYILFLNPDTTVQPRCLPSLVAELDKNPEIGAITAKLLSPNGQIQGVCARKDLTFKTLLCDVLGIGRVLPWISLFSGTRLPNSALRRRREVDGISGAFMMAPYALLCQINGFDESFRFGAEDLDLTKRIRELGRKVVYEPSAEAIHIGGQSRKLSPLWSLKQGSLGILLYFQKHHPKFPKGLILLLAWIRALSLFIASATVRPRISVRPCFDHLKWITRAFCAQVFKPFGRGRMEKDS